MTRCWQTLEVEILLRRILEKLRAAPRENEESREDKIQLATAVLLVEMSRADFEEIEAEAQAIEQLLARHFDLDAAASELLAELAREEADRSVSIHDYTRTLHDGLSESEKTRVVEMLWEVALADRELDKYEDYLVRKVAELLYVPHHEVVRLRHTVSDRLDK